VNYNTIARIYLDLDRDGVISTQRGRGTFVAGVPDEVQVARMRRGKLRAIVRSALEEARTLGYAPDEIAEVFEEGLARWREENGGWIFKAAGQWEKGIVLRLGRFIGLKGPGPSAS
jgi:GntR family transcriptional regulator